MKVDIEPGELSSTRFRTEILEESFNGAPVVRAIAVPSSESRSPVFVGLTVASGAGGGAIELRIRLPNGEEHNILGTRTVAELEAFRKSRAEKPGFEGQNTTFLPQFMAPLFPTLRLRGQKKSESELTSVVMGFPVTVPRNHGLGPGQIPHSLHGHLHFQHLENLEILRDQDAVTIQGDIPASATRAWWTGDTAVRMIHRLMADEYRFEMRIQNVGTSPVPVAMGAHPYFQPPSGDISAVRIVIPSRERVQIDNYENVLPVGTIIPAMAPYDFSNLKGTAISIKDPLDDYYYLRTPRHCTVNFIDVRAGLNLEMSSLYPNIIGVQAYAPTPGGLNYTSDFPVALELQTAVSDPRKEIWGELDTGVRLLNPNESTAYGFKIKAFQWSEERNTSN